MRSELCLMTPQCLLQLWLKVNHRENFLLPILSIGSRPSRLFPSSTAAAQRPKNVFLPTCKSFSNRWRNTISSIRDKVLKSRNRPPKTFTILKIQKPIMDTLGKSSPPHLLRSSLTAIKETLFSKYWENVHFYLPSYFPNYTWHHDPLQPNRESLLERKGVIRYSGDSRKRALIQWIPDTMDPTDQTPAGNARWECLCILCKANRSDGSICQA